MHEQLCELNGEDNNMKKKKKNLTKSMTDIDGSKMVKTEITHSPHNN
jgi:hypothetical protein